SGPLLATSLKVRLPSTCGPLRRIGTVHTPANDAATQRIGLKARATRMTPAAHRRLAGARSRCSHNPLNLLRERPTHATATTAQANQTQATGYASQILTKTSCGYSR